MTVILYLSGLFLFYESFVNINDSYSKQLTRGKVKWFIKENNLYVLIFNIFKNLKIDKYINMYKKVLIFK